MRTANVEDREYETNADHYQWCDAVPVLVQRVRSMRHFQPDTEEPEGDAQDHREPQRHNKIVDPSKQHASRTAAQTGAATADRLATMPRMSARLDRCIIVASRVPGTTCTDRECSGKRCRRRSPPAVL